MRSGFQRATWGELRAFTVLTTYAKAAMSELHHRMPVILGPEAAGAWLDASTPPTDLQALLRPCPDDWIESLEVGPAVGNVRS